MKQSVDGFERITIDPEMMNGQPCIRGMRVTVRRVLEMLPNYPDWASLITDYPELQTEDIAESLRFAAQSLDDHVLVHRAAWLNLLLDQGMPRAAADHLRAAGWEVAHVGELGMATAKDAEILDAATKRGACVVTMDADFHGLLAISGADSPSVIRLRIQGMQAREFADMLLRLAPQFEQAATSGALITIDERTVRIHRLPLTRKPKAEP